MFAQMEKSELICDTCIRDNRSHRIEYSGDYHFTECLGYEDVFYEYICDRCGQLCFSKNEKLEDKEWIA